jgi:hypothetical protein
MILNEVYYICININNDTMSQFEVNKAIIQHYFEAYNNKNEAIFEEMVSPLILEIFFLQQPWRIVWIAFISSSAKMDCIDDNGCYYIGLRFIFESYCKIESRGYYYYFIAIQIHVGGVL